MTEQNKDVYQRITDQIVAAIERGANEWRMPWHVRVGQGTARPLNVVSRRAYRGVNVLALWAAAQEADHPTGVWGNLSAMGRIGSASAQGRARHSRRLLESLRSQTMATRTTPPHRTRNARGPGAGDFLRAGTLYSMRPRSTASPLRHHANDRWSNATWPQSAFLMRSTSRPSSAAIALTISRAGQHSSSPFELFGDATSAYAVRAHECAHATGASHRLARDLSGRLSAPT
jgi:hypothetical protein